MSWPPLEDVPNPPGLLPCRLCHGMCMETEQVEDWNGRGKVIRIWSLCDQADELEKDDVRTEFLPEAEAVAEWNAMQT